MSNYLVVGGSSGIGKALVGLLEKEGHQIFASYCKYPIESRENTNYFYLDVLSDTISFEDIPDTLDGIVYCPGSIQLKPFSRIKEQEFINDYKLQVLGAVKVIQALLPNLRKSTYHIFSFRTCLKFYQLTTNTN